MRVVGVAYDGSPEAQRALGRAARAACTAGALLRIFGVVHQNAVWFGGYLGHVAGLDLHDHLAEQLDRAAHRVGAPVVASPEILQGDPVEELSLAAAECDLLFVGSRSHGLVRRTLMGSVATGLARTPPCAVVVVPRGSAPAPEDSDVLSELSLVSAAGRLLLGRS